jgi:DNA repair protein RadC
MTRTIDFYDKRDLINKLQCMIHEESIHIAGPGQSYGLVKKYARSTQENFLAILLDNAQNLLSVKHITKGLINRTLVHPREIFRPAILANATAIILCHNHPSGNMEPSLEDLDITQRLKNAGELIGIPILDHLIVSKNGYYSMAERGTF